MPVKIFERLRIIARQDLCGQRSEQRQFVSPLISMDTKLECYILAEFDVIEPDSVVLLNVTDGKKNDKKIYWTAPETPNGYVLGYYAKLIRDDGNVRYFVVMSITLIQCLNIEISIFIHYTSILVYIYLYYHI